MRIFVDTNVLFDIIARREPFAEAATKLVCMRAMGDAELWAAPQSYLDVFYVCDRAHSMPASDLQQALARSTAFINVCTTTQDDLVAACEAGWDDMEDALIGLSCKKVAADYLMTRDDRQSGFKALGIPVCTPEAFFEMLARDMGVTYAIEDL